MQITLFLASLWGPVLLAIGIGFFVSRNYYLKIYRDLERESFALLIFGMVGIAAGIAQITVHNAWNTLPEVIVSLLGWGVLIKAAVFVIKPDIADNGGDWMAASKLLPIAGVAMIVLGAYLSWFAYF